MSFPHSGNAGPEWHPTVLPEQRPGFQPSRVADVLPFGSVATEWEKRTVAFLRAHPGSSLLAVVQHLWPDFLALPSERRAPTWFWVKDQLRALRDKGMLDCREDRGGVALWSVA